MGKDQARGAKCNQYYQGRNQGWGHIRPMRQSQQRQYQSRCEVKLNAPNHRRKAVVCKHHVWVLPRSHLQGSLEALHQGVEKKLDSAGLAKILYGVGGGIGLLRVRGFRYRALPIVRIGQGRGGNLTNGVPELGGRAVVAKLERSQVRCRRRRGSEARVAR